MPDTRGLIPSDTHSRTLVIQPPVTPTHSPIQLNTQDLIPSDTCTPSETFEI